MKSKRLWIIALSAVLTAAVAGVIVFAALHKKNKPAEPEKVNDTNSYAVTFALPEKMTELERNNTTLPENVTVQSGTKIGEPLQCDVPFLVVRCGGNTAREQRG